MWCKNGRRYGGMTCRESCIHYNVCDYVSFTSTSVEKDCKDFKNKADFVEIVRCEDCKFSYEHKFFRESYCEKTNRKITQHHFCGYGKRK
jgi:hypothetical protein